MAQFIQDWFEQLGIKVKSDVIEENALYDIMLPPEAGATYKAKYDMFIWSWYETVEPNVLLQIFLCNQIGTSSDSLWCNQDYDKLYDEQNLAPNDTPRKALIDQMQQLFYDQAPYHILYYDEELDAYRTDHFGGWQNQPIDGGYPLFSYSAIDYQFLTDPNAVPSPSPRGAARVDEPGSSAGRGRDRERRAGTGADAGVRDLGGPADRADRPRRAWSWSSWPASCSPGAAAPPRRRSDDRGGPGSSVPARPCAPPDRPPHGHALLRPEARLGDRHDRPDRPVQLHPVPDDARLARSGRSCATRTSAPRSWRRRGQRWGLDKPLIPDQLVAYVGVDRPG